MQATLQRFGINKIWHFTDRVNIQSIMDSGGLLSLSELRRKRMNIPAPGGNQWSHDADITKGVDDYVHLAFTNDHPMLFIARKDNRITNPVWIQINTEVLASPHIRYTMDVSNKKGVCLLTAKEAVAELDCQVLFTQTDWKDPAIQARRRLALKSEILIPKRVPKEMFIEITNG